MQEIVSVTQVCCLTNPLRPPLAATSPASAGEDLLNERKGARVGSLPSFRSVGLEVVG